MKNMKFWRTALVATLVLTVMLSVTGGTIAWFTDSVESKANVIEAGNLDVDVHVDGDTSIQTVNTLFNDVKLWEPGAVAWENLTVVNEGNLALKYQMTINAANENNLNGNVLSDVLKVGVVPNGVSEGATRETVLAQVGEANWKAFANYYEYGELKAGDEGKTYGVVVYWQPTTEDNKWNANNGQETSDGEPLHIDLGIKLQATQMMAEMDSFNNNEYDKDASFEADPLTDDPTYDWYFENPDAPEFELNSAEDLAGLFELVNGTASAPAGVSLLAETETTVSDDFKGQTIKLNTNIDLNNAEWTPIGKSGQPFKGTFDGQGHIIANLKISGNNSDVGLFGFTTEGEIKNVHVHNASVSGYLNVGVVAGTPYTSKYSNIKVTGLVQVNGFAYVGAVGGKNAYANWDNITVDVAEGSYVKANSVENGRAYRTYVGGVIGFMGEGGHTVSNVTSNIDVYGSTCDVGGVVGIAHYGNNFVNVSSSGNVTITNATEAADAEEMGGIAGVWNNGGANVTLTNCKFTGKLSANITEGVDLSDNTLTGKAYSSTGNGALIIDGKMANKVVDSAEELEEALKAGASTLVIGKGNYSMPDGSDISLRDKSLTIIGTKDTVIDVSNIDARDQFVTGATVVFDGVTLNFGKVNYMGFANTASLTYKNCTINGLQFLFGENVVFENCDLNSNGAEHTVWTYGAQNVSFTNCDFTYGDRGINCYSDNDVPGGKQTVNFKNCTFSTENTASAGAVEINSYYFSKGIEVNLEGCTAPAYGEMAYVSPWDSTNGAKTTINIK